MNKRNNRLAALVVGLGLLSLLTAKPASAGQRSADDMCLTICAPITDCEIQTTSPWCENAGCVPGNSTCASFGTCAGNNGRLVNCFQYAQ